MKPKLDAQIRVGLVTSQYGDQQAKVLLGEKIKAVTKAISSLY